MRGGQRPGVPAQGPLRQEITIVVQVPPAKRVMPAESRKSTRVTRNDMSAAKAKRPSKGEEPQEPEVIPTPRLQEKYHKEILPALAEKLGRSEPAVAAPLAEDRGQHGRGQGDQRKEAHGRRAGRDDADRRPKAAESR